jgi:hypothetical protein
MKGMNFLYSKDINICLNPFEERVETDKINIMPGFKL